MVLDIEEKPEERRKSVLVLIFKNKGDVQRCSNYRRIKLMSHIVKVRESIVEVRLKEVVMICEQQHGFMPRKGTADATYFTTEQPLGVTNQRISSARPTPG